MATILDLPIEILLEIFDVDSDAIRTPPSAAETLLGLARGTLSNRPSQLSISDLSNLRLVNRLFSNILAPVLFRTLTLPIGVLCTDHRWGDGRWSRINKGSRKGTNVDVSRSQLQDVATHVERLKIGVAFDTSSKTGLQYDTHVISDILDFLSGLKHVEIDIPECYLDEGSYEWFIRYWNNLMEDFKMRRPRDIRVSAKLCCFSNKIATEFIQQVDFSQMSGLELRGGTRRLTNLSDQVVSPLGSVLSRNCPDLTSLTLGGGWQPLLLTGLLRDIPDGEVLPCSHLNIDRRAVESYFNGSTWLSQDFRPQDAVKLRKLKSLTLHTSKPQSAVGKASDFWRAILASGAILEELSCGSPMSPDFLSYLSLPALGSSLTKLELVDFIGSWREQDKLLQYAVVFWTAVVPNIQTTLTELTLMILDRGLIIGWMAQALQTMDVITVWTLSCETLSPPADTSATGKRSIPPNGFPNLRKLKTYILYENSGNASREISFTDVMGALGACPKLRSADLMILHMLPDRTLWDLEKCRLLTQNVMEDIEDRKHAGTKVPLGAEMKLAVVCPMYEELFRANEYFYGSEGWNPRGPVSTSVDEYAGYGLDW